MDTREVRQLIDKYLNGQCSDEERRLVESFYADQLSSGEISEEIERGNELKAAMWKVVAGHIEQPPKHRLFNFHRWPAAAAVLLIASCTIVALWVARTAKEPALTFTITDIPPGTQKAFLKLADGQEVILSDAKNGVIATQSQATITKNTKGQIVYQHHADAKPVGINEISTPRGGEYQVVLPDRTHVWLNAATTLKFPTAFTGKERVIELDGEAYFEVAKDKKHPFIVRSNGQSVQVLGTHFNIKSYKDESAIVTTLLEGSVTVTKNGHQTLLIPGEQAIATDKIQVSEVDVDAAVAWKNGKTVFDHNDIPTMMRGLSRWYNVDVEYRGSVPQRSFTGGISRQSNLSGVLKILQSSGINARIEDKKIVIQP
ncbi:FecR domain-containing protein [Mucilaginibacter defluvii]|uniref:DUF4974 domain-containing protein n=1 Tax=Mucilaginibacter defluvii TaxID=1196019 RepID=A0ABP9FKB2_9SPHI